MRVELSVPISIQSVCDRIKAAPKKGLCSMIYAISTDTRECKQGDLFIALEGKNDSGEKYVNDALKKGCAVISSQDGRDIISVKDTATALLDIAGLYKTIINPKYTVAVTGSVGKSTTLKFLSKTLGKTFVSHCTKGNYNNQIGVPLTVLSMDKSTELLIIELGMNHKNEISELSKCVCPNISIITSVGTAHIGYLGCREEIAKAKLEILDGMKTPRLIVPDNEQLLTHAKGRLTVGRNSSLSDFSLNDTGSDRFSFVSAYGTIDDLNFFTATEHLLIDLSYAISTAQILGVPKRSIQDGVSAINESDLRQRFIRLQNYTIFDDSYNASRESILADFNYLSKLKRPIGAFLGDILELGDNSEDIHEHIGYAAAKIKIDHLYLFGEYAEYTARGAINGGMDSSKIFINTDKNDPYISIDHIKRNSSYGETILFKASHKLRFDKLADQLVEEERAKDGRI